MTTKALNPISQPFDIRLELPGSKSFANRALVCVALSGRECVIRNVSPADDTALMLNVLADLGWAVTRPNRASTEVTLKPPAKPYAHPVEIYTGPAGTTTRFSTALLTAVPGEFTLDANARMRERPMGDLINVLRSLGAEIEELGNPGCVPLRIKGGSLRGGECSIAGDVSSQFLSALMMVAPTRGGGVTIDVDGELVSKPYADITLQVMRDMGLSDDYVKRDGHTRFIIGEGEYGAPEYSVPPDGTAASYFWGAAAITGSKCVINNLTRQDVQGDVAFVGLLEQMGCKVLEFQDGLGIDATGAGALSAHDADLSALPDCAQTLAVVCAFAKGTSRLSGLGTLRVKETDRIAALQEELGKLGVQTQAGDDWLEIEGNPELKLADPVNIATYDDHRMAMSFALAGLRVPVNIEEPDVVSKSFPTFWDVWSEVVG
ncbi:MAG: 3-phosphoshikimate 1-carboxyvinyltransferase [Planctomycetota bacterium]|jgi:3-phosphoshikimate 1-carboxyvinyltransferase